MWSSPALDAAGIDYERAGGISQQEANEIVSLAKDLRSDLMAWLAASHPNLMIGKR